MQAQGGKRGPFPLFMKTKKKKRTSCRKKREWKQATLKGEEGSTIRDGERGESRNETKEETTMQTRQWQS